MSSAKESCVGHSVGYMGNWAGSGLALMWERQWCTTQPLEGKDCLSFDLGGKEKDQRRWRNSTKVQVWVEKQY